jgi:DNA modification methylase
MGSGTTAVAAVSCNRRYLGYDINQEYIDISEKRIAEYNNPK